MHRRVSSPVLPLAVTLCLLASSAATAQILIVGNKSDDTIDLINLESGLSFATVATGGSPHEIAVSPDGRTAVVTNYGNRDRAGRSLTVVDLASAKATATVETGRHTRPHGIHFLDAKRLVVTTEGSQHLLVVDVSSGEILREIATGQEIAHMVAVTPEGRRAFVANIGSGTVTAVDLVQGAKLADIETGAGAEGIAATPDGREIWVTNRAADTVSIIDPVSLEVTASFPCASFPIRVEFTPDGRLALISVARSGELAVFDVADRRELARRKLDLTNAPDASNRLFGDRFGGSPVPVGIEIAPDGKRAWVAATQADAVVEVDPRDLDVLRVLEAGHEPDGMAYSPIAVPEN